MKYNPDSYLLYGTAKPPRPRYPIRVRVIMKDAVKADVLERAAQSAIKRYPYFAVRVEVDGEGGYVLEPNERPIAVLATQRKAPALGSETVNRHLAFIDYEGCDIFFNIHHTLTGAVGLYEWAKTTLYEYVREAYGVTPDSDGIHLPDSPLLPGETDFPDVHSLKAKAYEPPFTNADVNHFIMQNIIGALCPFFTPKDYTFEFEQDALLDYAKKHGGTPASVLSVLMFKALDKVLPQKAQLIATSVSHNFRKNVGCPNSYRDLVQQLYLPFKRDMVSWSVSDLCAFARNKMQEQMTPENAAAEMQRVVKDYEFTDTLPTLEAKRKYNLMHSRYMSQLRGTFVVSYLGQKNWGGLEPYIQAAYTISEGHMVMQALNISGKFCVSIFTVVPSHKHINAFCQTLDNEGLAYTIKGPFKKNLPDVDIPKA